MCFSPPASGRLQAWRATSKHAYRKRLRLQSVARRPWCCRNSTKIHGLFPRQLIVIFVDSPWALCTSQHDSLLLLLGNPGGLRRMQSPTLSLAQEHSHGNAFQLGVICRSSLHCVLYREKSYAPLLRRITSSAPLPGDFDSSSDLLQSSTRTFPHWVCFSVSS